MHEASEKRKRGSSNGMVNIRLNVKPLCGNWKPVKLYECNEVPIKMNHAPSPAEEQLDSTVWKTKNIRTNTIKAVTVFSGENEEHPQKRSEQNSSEESPERVPGLVSKCECANCENADRTPTSLELSAKCAFDESYLKRKKRIREKNKKRNHRSESSAKHHRQRHRRFSSSATRSLSTPPPIPPNSVVSRESQQEWCKLYEEACQPRQINYSEKMPTNCGPIELSSENISTPPTAKNSPEDNPNSHPSSNTLPVIRPPPVSPPSNVPEHIYSLPPSHQPPLVPQPPCQPQPNVVILPPPIDTPKLQNNFVSSHGPSINPANSPRAPMDRDSSLSVMPLPPAVNVSDKANSSTSTGSIIRNMERIFYNSESNWWMIVALIMLTIFAYRTSIEQHTCYYD